MYKRRDVSATLVRRAESLGFKAIVLTVDTPVLGRREADIRNKYAVLVILTTSFSSTTNHNFIVGTYCYSCLNFDKLLHSHAIY